MLSESVPISRAANGAPCRIEESAGQAAARHPNSLLIRVFLADYICSVKLPNGTRANLGAKLEEYSLNRSHRHGQHKARVFQSVLGITLNNASVLREALKQAAADSEDVVRRGNNGFGENYELRFPLKTDKGAAIVLSAWIIRNDEDFPRLTTCFIV